MPLILGGALSGSDDLSNDWPTPSDENDDDDVDGILLLPVVFLLVWGVPVTQVISTRWLAGLEVSRTLFLRI